MVPNNPVSTVLDETFVSLQQDQAKRPLQGFIQFARFSVEFERFQREQLADFVTDPQHTVPVKLYYLIAMAIQYGWESGKNYVINGGVEKMLAAEDECNRLRVFYEERMRQQQQPQAPPPEYPLEEKK